MDSTSVILVDRTQLFREGIRRILEGSKFTIDVEGSSLQEVLSRVGEARPDLAMFDFEAGATEIPDAVERLRALNPAILTVVLTEKLCTGDLTSGLAARVDGYLLKDMSVEALMLSLNLILVGQKIFPADCAHLLVNERIAADGTSTDLGADSTITPREKQILAGLLNGLSNKGIAQRLDLAEATVKAQLKSVLRKIHLQNRTQAAVWALKNGITADAFTPFPGPHSQQSRQVGAKGAPGNGATAPL